MAGIVRRRTPVQWDEAAVQRIAARVRELVDEDIERLAEFGLAFEEPERRWPSYRYLCEQCAGSIDTPLRLERLPGVLLRDGGVMHTNDDTGELCGPVRLVEEGDG